MNNTNYPDHWYDVDTTLYNRSARLMAALKRNLRVHIDLHADPQVLQGDIFLFNHFSRFETFIPQLLLYERLGVYCCAIASAEFFKEDNALAWYLSRVGVIPHDHPHIFSLLAAQVLRGRKVIIFPEGGMVKDHQVLDKEGVYSIYSRISGVRRKQHTGAAVLGQGIELFKAAIRHAAEHDQQAQLSRWQTYLQFDSVDQLLVVAHKPTLIVPANITFYPIRASENLLFKSVELFKDDMSMRQAEELLIEGNLLLKDTDMDIRMGKLISPCGIWDERTQRLIKRILPELDTLTAVFGLSFAPKNLSQRVLGKILVQQSEQCRNQYMEKMYSLVTINLSHLASTLILIYIAQGQSLIEKRLFYSMLYIAIKHLQNNQTVHLHRSLLNPDDYSDLMQSTNTRFDYFISAAKEAELIQERNDSYQFLPKLCAEVDFDEIRIENPIVVYNNEAAPVRIVHDTLRSAIQAYSMTSERQFAAWHFEDEKLIFAWEKKSYTKPKYADINGVETFDADSKPYFILPEQVNGFGILLVHGLLASPAELRAYGDYLARQGYTVLGIRLKGHGTSPYALQEQSWQDWYACVQRGFKILKVYCPQLYVIGFSTGGALALALAAEQHHEIIGIVAVSVPLKFVNPAFMLVSLLQGTNKLIAEFSNSEGLKPFIENEPEHPHINYQHVPVRALSELRLLIEQLEPLLPKVTVPTLMVYAEQDPVVAPSSAAKIFAQLGSRHKQIQAIKANRHGILMENLGGIWQILDKFISHVSQPYII